VVLEAQISDAVYRQLVTDAAAEHERRPGRAPRDVSRVQRGRLEPAHRNFGSATSRTRPNDATPHSHHAKDRLTHLVNAHRGCRGRCSSVLGRGPLVASASRPRAVGGVRHTTGGVPGATRQSATKALLARRTSAAPRWHRDRSGRSAQRTLGDES
jgi:hypothetical protein